MGVYFFTGPEDSVLQKTATTQKDGETHKDAIIRKFQTAGLSTRVKVKLECGLRGIDPDVPGFGDPQTEASYRQALVNLAGQISDHDDLHYGITQFNQKPPKAQRAAASQLASSAKQASTEDDAKRPDSADLGGNEPEEDGVDEGAILPSAEPPLQVNRLHHPITAGKGLYYRGPSETPEPSQRAERTPRWMWRAYEDIANAQRTMSRWINDKNRPRDGQILAAKDIMVQLEEAYKGVGTFAYGHMQADAKNQLPSPSFVKKSSTATDFASEQGPSFLLSDDWPDRYPHRYDRDSTTRYLPNWSRSEAPTWSDFKKAATDRGIRNHDIVKAFGSNADSDSSQCDKSWRGGLKKPLDQYGRRGWQKGNLSAEMARRRIHQGPSSMGLQNVLGGLPGGNTGTLPCHSEFSDELAEAQSATLHLLNYEMEGATRRFGGAILQPLQERLDELRARFHQRDGGVESNTSEAGFKLPPPINYPVRSQKSEVTNLVMAPSGPKRRRSSADVREEGDGEGEEERVRKAARLGQRPPGSPIELLIIESDSDSESEGNEQGEEEDEDQ